MRVHGLSLAEGKAPGLFSRLVFTDLHFCSGSQLCAVLAALLVQHRRVLCLHPFWCWGFNIKKKKEKSTLDSAASQMFLVFLQK